MFSNFYLSPIIIASKVYKTVEHWYQANKSDNEEQHEVIRNSPDPESAKEIGRKVRERVNWQEEQVGFMYRGLVAKYRQHPNLGDILLSTGDAPIHEQTADPIWGWNQGKGPDLLGQLLMTVRNQLRHGLGRIEDTRIKGQLAGSFHSGYQVAAGIRISWDHQGAWLSHMIRQHDNVEPEKLLIDILTQGYLKPSMLSSGYPAVCFTAAPFSMLKRRCLGEEATLRRQERVAAYSGYGVGIPFDLGRELGIMPVIPIAPDDLTRIPDQMRYRVQFYSAQMQYDWTYELEWRSATPVDIPDRLAAVIVPTTVARKVIMKEMRVSLRFLILSDAT